MESRRGTCKCGRQREGEANKEVEGRIYMYMRVWGSKEGAGREEVNLDGKKVQQKHIQCIYMENMCIAH